MLEDFQQQYQAWRDEKLANYRSTPDALFVEKKNIEWLASKELDDALSVLNNFLSSNSDTHQYQLTRGEGLICNNVVHNRSAFVNSALQKRTLPRGRYKNTVVHYE